VQPILLFNAINHNLVSKKIIIYCFFSVFKGIHLLSNLKNRNVKAIQKFLSTAHSFKSETGVGNYFFLNKNCHHSAMMLPTHAQFQFSALGTGLIKFLMKNDVQPKEHQNVQNRYQ